MFGAWQPPQPHMFAIASRLLFLPSGRLPAFSSPSLLRSFSPKHAGSSLLETSNVAPALLLLFITPLCGPISSRNGGPNNSSFAPFPFARWLKKC